MYMKRKKAKQKLTGGRGERTDNVNTMAEQDTYF